MDILLEWNKKKYELSDFRVRLKFPATGNWLTNPTPGTIECMIELPLSANPAQEFIEFLFDQPKKAEKDGRGTIKLQPTGKGKKDSAKPIEFDYAYFSHIKHGFHTAGVSDGPFVQATIVAAEITMFEVLKCVDKQRLDVVTK